MRGLVLVAPGRGLVVSAVPSALPSVSLSVNTPAGEGRGGADNAPMLPRPAGRNTVDMLRTVAAMASWSDVRVAAPDVPDCPLATLRLSSSDAPPMRRPGKLTRDRGGDDPRAELAPTDPEDPTEPTLSLAAPPPDRRRDRTLPSTPGDSVARCGDAVGLAPAARTAPAPARAPGSAPVVVVAATLAERPLAVARPPAFLTGNTGTRDCGGGGGGAAAVPAPSGLASVGESRSS